MSMVATVHARHVKLFKNGRNQAVRIPREFELPGEDAILRKDGDRLILEPAPPPSLLAVLASLKPIDEEFAHIEDALPDQVEL
jgi:antitoxin VapB